MTEIANTPQFLAKDFIETAEGLCFAVVQNGLEHGKVLCFLRYVQQNQQWRKIATQEANHFLQTHYPDYLHYSKVLNANLHAVDVKKIAKHYQPKQRLQTLLNFSKNEKPHSFDNVTQDLIHLCQLFQETGLNLKHIGVTGSLLIGAQNANSDIDLVIYHRATFHHARQITENLTRQNKLQALSAKDWKEAFARRDCELAFSDYIWHEQRKFNKGLINQRKFDLSLLEESSQFTETYAKHGTMTLTVQIYNDSYGFDYPARFLVSHPEINEILSFTATYNGQAQTGEWVEVAGQLEVSMSGKKRIIVGSSREARGEYIKVVRP